MEFVEPIRSSRHIAQIKNTLRGANLIRDLLLFELGINSALRISDLLGLKVAYLWCETGEIHDFFILKEQKTKKTNKIYITASVMQTMKRYQECYPQVVACQDNYVFFSKRTKVYGAQHITRKMAWIHINQWCQEICGLRGNFGGHTLRKTRGYHARQKGISIELIQHKLNHSSMTITKRYLGITDDEIEQACRQMDL